MTDLHVVSRLRADVEVAVLTNDLRISEHRQLVGQALGGVGRGRLGAVEVPRARLRLIGGHEVDFLAPPTEDLLHR